MSCSIPDFTVSVHLAALRGHIWQSGPRFHASAHDPISLNQRVQGSSPCAPTIEVSGKIDKIWHRLSAPRAPMREPEEEKKPVGVPLTDLTHDQFFEIADPPLPCHREGSVMRNVGRRWGTNFHARSETSAITLGYSH